MRLRSAFLQVTIHRLLFLELEDQKRFGGGRVADIRGLIFLGYLALMQSARWRERVDTTVENRIKNIV